MGIPEPVLLHLESTVLIAFAAALAFSRFSGRKSAFQSVVAGVLAALAFGQFQEIAVLAMNDRVLSPAALREACAADMALNLEGAAVAASLLAVAAGAMAALRKVAFRSGFIFRLSTFDF